MIDMFPIVSTPKNEPYQYLTSIVNKQPWLIADRANLRNQFQHLLPVLAFSPDFILKIKPFLLALDIKERFLSERATSITEAHGDDVNLHSRLTKEYRSRSKYFFRYPFPAPDFHYSEHSLLSGLYQSMKEIRSIYVRGLVM